MVNKPSIKDSTVLIVAVVLVAGTISNMIPASFAQSYYNDQQYNGYEDSYGKDYDMKKASDLNLQKINCNNIILNQLDSAGQGTTGGEDMINGLGGEDNDWTGQQDGQWLGNGGEKDLSSIDKNIVNYCKNKNKIVEVEEQGAVGPPGPSGITQLINGENIYPISERTLGQGSISSLTALCDSGDFILNGGYNLHNLIPVNAFVFHNGPLFNGHFPGKDFPAGGGWVTEIIHIGADIDWEVFGYCFDNPPAHIP